MYSPIKLNKINPKLSGSRRQQKSYTDRYKQKSKGGSPSPPSFTDFQSGWKVEIKGPGEGEEGEGEGVQSIKIEEEVDEYQVMKNEYMEMQLMWSKQISETRGQIHSIKEQIKLEQRGIKEMEKALSWKRRRAVSLEEKARKTRDTLQALPLENYDDYIHNFQDQYDKIDQIGETQIAEARRECEEVRNQINHLDEAISAVQAELNELAEFQAERYYGRMSEVRGQEERMKGQIEEMEGEMERLGRSIREKEGMRPIKEQIHRRYLELYEKMFINQELDVMASLIDYKQQEIKRFEDYGKRKVVFKSKRKEIEEIETRIGEKKKSIAQLEEEIRDRSTIFLNLHQWK